LVKYVGDFRLISGKRMTTKNKGTEKVCLQTRPNNELSTTEELASGKEHCTVHTAMQLLVTHTSAASTWTAQTSAQILI